MNPFATRRIRSRTAVDKLTDCSEFTGAFPAGPFRGLPDTRL